MNDVKDLAQKRSQFAYGCVQSFVDSQKNDEKQKKYKGYIRSTPMKVLTNGLGATIAFIFSKRLKSDSEIYNQINAHIYDWLQKEYNKHLIQLDKKETPEEKSKELTNKIIHLESPEYRAVTNEVLALFNWLKRFADGMIEGDGDGNE
jgi:CRISPR-associated protein Cmr5